MSTTPPDAPPGPAPVDQGPRTSREELRDLGRIRRTTGRGRKVAGVAGGLARHLDIDPIILRVAFVVLVFFGGSGLLLYGACWLLLPEDGQERAPLSLDDRSRSIALVIVGGIAALLLLGDSIGQFDFPWPLVFVAAIALVVLVFLDRDRDRPRPGAPTAPPVPHTLDPQTQQYVPAEPGSWTPPPAYALPPRPRNPRRRGPVLFWFTLLASVVLVAGLGVLELAGMAVAPAAYPAVVVATSGVMLLLSAFWGRGGGLVLLGLLAAVAMALSSVSGSVEGADIERTPSRAADVPDHLSTGGGEIVLDLTSVTDPDALDGRTLTQRVRAGRIEVIVPESFGVRVDTSIATVGHVELFGSERGGFGLDDASTRSAAAGAPTITLDAQAFAGEIVIRTDEQEYYTP